MRGLVRVRPRRSRCARRGSLHAPPPTFLLLRWADLAEVIGAALAARALEQGARPIAAASGRAVSAGAGRGCSPWWPWAAKVQVAVRRCGWDRRSRSAWLRCLVAGAARQSRSRSGGQRRGPCGGAPEPRLLERPSCGQCPAGEGGLCRRPRAGGRGAGAVVAGGRGRKDWSWTVRQAGHRRLRTVPRPARPGPKRSAHARPFAPRPVTLNRRVLPATLDSSLRRIPHSGTNQDSRAKTRRITVRRGGSARSIFLSRTIYPAIAGIFCRDRRIDREHERLSSGHPPVAWIAR